MTCLKYQTMKPFSPRSAIPFLVHMLILVSANLDSDKQALLQFATSVPHQRTLNWNSTTPVCSWIGITCNNDSTNVVAVRLPGVGLMGHIPENTLGNLDALKILSLRSNLLSGTLPLNIISLPSLQYIYLQHNNFSGEIPNSLSSQLVVLDLSFNTFTGNFPETISNLTHLTGLNLANNYLSGTIPNLDVSNLKHLDLSHNNLSGSIPNSLQKFPNSSFVGNALLCGPPLQVCSSPSPLPHSPPHPQPPNERKSKKLRVGVIIAIAVGGAALLILVALVIFLCCFKRKQNGISSSIKGNPSSTSGNKPKEVFGSGVQEPEKNKLVFFEGCSYNFDLEDLLRASAEVLGKGSFGTAYKAVLEESVTVVVKRLKEVGVGKKEFEQQMEMVGRIGQHPNVLQLRAYYYSKDEKLLVYDYVPGGSLAALLHGNKGVGRGSLDWESRVKISLSIARGIAHIHSAGGPKISHGNIKSSNVLLLEPNQPDASISDFGLAPIMTVPTTPSRSPGYRAPETIETRKNTHKSDVYSFGVLLLELLTGKSPLQSPGRDDMVDLPRWVQSVVREEWTAEVFDVELMKYQNIEEEMVQMLQIAMSCVSRVADTRPSISEVVKMVEEIRQLDSDTRPSSDENKSKDSTGPTP